MRSTKATDKPKADARQRTLTFVAATRDVHDNSANERLGDALRSQRLTLDHNNPNNDSVLPSSMASELVSTSSQLSQVNGNKNNVCRKRKYIQCCLYGQIRFPPLLVAVIDTPEFQRLRRLKQLGTLHLVYPSATHTRFEHSLGVSHRAGELVKRIHEEQPGLGITEADQLCVMLAGLCHDLGHGPFSHQFEHFMKELAERFPEGSEERGRLNGWRHEDMSVKMLRHLIQVNDIDVSAAQYGGLTEQDLLFVEEMIDGRKDRRGRSADKAFLYDIVNNTHSGLDVDKLDYLVSFHALFNPFSSKLA